MLKFRPPLAVFAPTLLVTALLGACNADTPPDADAFAASAPAGASAASDVVAATQEATDADAPTAMAPYQMTVYKSPTCGCCKDWVTYMQEEGFAATSVETDDVDSIKAANGLTDARLKSCHTALIGGYVIEGHVPADDVRRLLTERPDVVGLSAPGMPMLSPGMGSREPQDYDVIAFDENGGMSVWSSY